MRAIVTKLEGKPEYRGAPKQTVKSLEEVPWPAVQAQTKARIASIEEELKQKQEINE